MSKTNSKYFYGVGRRKQSTARAKYYPSESDVKITVDGKPIEKAFQELYLLEDWFYRKPIMPDY